MKYRNLKTGAIVETNSVITGSNWEAVAAAAAPEKKPVKKGTAKK